MMKDMPLSTTSVVNSSNSNDHTLNIKRCEEKLPVCTLQKSGLLRTEYGLLSLRYSYSLSVFVRNFTKCN